MGTNPKQKSKKTNWSFKVLSSKVCLSFLVLISIGLSSSFGYDSQNFLLEKEQENLENKDIGEFGERLSERLKGVFGEVITLITKGKSDTSGTLLSGFFLDTDTHEYKYFIDSLSQSNIIQGAGNQKFYPDNYMRVSDFIKILVNTYRYKVGYNLATTNGLSDDIYIQYSKNAQLQKYINTAYSLGFLNNISTGTINDFNFDKFLTTREISKIFDNINNQYPGLVSRVLLDISDLYTKRGECSKYIIQAFQIEGNKNIETESSLATNNQTKPSLLDNITKAIKDYYLQS